MKKVIVAVLFSFLFISGCCFHISKVIDKWGNPARIENQGDTVAYYYYFLESKSNPLDIYYGFDKGTAWKVVEIITDRKGKILKKRSYWKQPNVN